MSHSIRDTPAPLLTDLAQAALEQTRSTQLLVLSLHGGKIRIGYVGSTDADHVAIKTLADNLTAAIKSGALRWPEPTL